MYLMFCKKVAISLIMCAPAFLFISEVGSIWVALVAAIFIGIRIAIVTDSIESAKFGYTAFFGALVFILLLGLITSYFYGSFRKALLIVSILAALPDFLIAVYFLAKCSLEGILHLSTAFFEDLLGISPKYAGLITTIAAIALVLVKLLLPPTSVIERWVFIFIKVSTGLALLCGLAIVFEAALQWLLRKKEQKALEDNLAAAKANSELERETKKRRAECAEMRLKAIAETHLIIDSNIWMNSAYEAIFEALQPILEKNGYKIVLYGPQYDEICNIKKRAEHNSAKARGARCALSRIEYFQCSDVLRIERMTIDAVPNAYADPLIIEFIVKFMTDNDEATLISDDVELRTRVRAHAPEQSLIKIYAGQDLLGDCQDYCQLRGQTVDFSPVDVTCEEFIEVDEESDEAAMESESNRIGGYDG